MAHYKKNWSSLYITLRLEIYFVLKTWQIGVTCITGAPDLCHLDDHFSIYQRKFPEQDIKTIKPSIASCYLFINAKE